MTQTRTPSGNVVSWLSVMNSSTKFLSLQKLSGRYCSLLLFSPSLTSELKPPKLSGKDTKWLAMAFKTWAVNRKGSLCCQCDFCPRVQPQADQQHLVSAALSLAAELGSARCIVGPSIIQLMATILITVGPACMS